MNKDNLHQIAMKYGKDLFINSIHQDNPWVQDDSNYYVLFIDEKAGWVKYQTCTGRIKYLRSSDFETVFLRPKDIYYKTLISFIGPMYKSSELDIKVPNMYVGKPL